MKQENKSVRGIFMGIWAPIKDNDAFSNVNIRNALGFYTSRLAYQESFLNHDHRVDLDGKDVEALEQKHKDFALTMSGLIFLNHPFDYPLVFGVLGFLIFL